jgi:hypothetical protein
VLRGGRPRDRDTNLHLHLPLLSALCPTIPAHLILLDLITLIMFGEEYRAQCSWLFSLLHSPVHIIYRLLLLLLLLLFTAIEFSLGGSSPYTSPDNTNKNKYKRNNTKTQQFQYTYYQNIQLYRTQLKIKCIHTSDTDKITSSVTVGNS